jgi:hypothetical protein
VRAAVLGVAAGVLFGVGAAATKLTAGVAATDGLAGLLTSWPGYALALASVASFVLQQSAYAAGPLATVMTAVIITDPLTSYLLGIVGFGEPLPGPGAPLALTALGLLALVVGVAGLARSPLLQPEPEPRPEPEPAEPLPRERQSVELPAPRVHRPEPCVVAGCSD